MKAAKSGPVAEPALPPTWKIDCAKPCWPPEAMRATREDSGWKTDEPMPIMAAAARIMGKEEARDKTMSPMSVHPMPMLSEKGCGRLSV